VGVFHTPRGPAPFSRQSRANDTRTVQQASPPSCCPRPLKLYCEGRDKVVPPELMGLIRLLAVRSLGLICLHGACVSRPVGAVLLIAPSGVGKTTTALALAASGYTLLSDELTLLVPPWKPSPRVRGFLQPPLLSLLPEREKGRSTSGDKDWNAGTRSFPARALLFLERPAEQTGAFRVFPIARDGGAASTHAAAARPQLCARARSRMEAVVALVSSVPCHRLVLGRDLDTVTTVVDGLLGRLWQHSSIAGIVMTVKAAAAEFLGADEPRIRKSALQLLISDAVDDAEDLLVQAMADPCEELAARRGRPTLSGSRGYACSLPSCVRFPRGCRVTPAARRWLNLRRAIATWLQSENPQRLWPVIARWQSLPGAIPDLLENWNSWGGGIWRSVSRGNGPAFTLRERPPDPLRPYL